MFRRSRHRGQHGLDGVTPIVDGLVNGFIIVVGELPAVADPRADPGIELVPVPTALLVSEAPPGADDVIPVGEVSVDVDPLPIVLVEPVVPVRLDDELGDDNREVLGVAVDGDELVLVVGDVEVKLELLDAPMPLVVLDDPPELGKQGLDD